MSNSSRPRRNRGLFARIAQWGFSFGMWLTTPYWMFRAWWARTLDGFQAQQRRRGQKAGFLRLAGFALTLPFRLAAALAVGTAMWLQVLGKRSRIWYLVQGIPAVLGILTAAVLAMIAWNPKFDSGPRYETAAQAAYEEGDFGLARICYERLLGEGLREQEAQYGLGQTLYALGNRQLRAAEKLESQGEVSAADRNQAEALKTEAEELQGQARQLISDLAGSARQGYAKAHYWMANHIAETKTPSKQTLRQVLFHLNRTVEAEPEHIGANVHLAQIYQSQGDFKRAIEHLKRVAAAQPQLHLDLALLYRRTKDLAQSNHEARLAAEHFKRVCEKDPDAHLDRMKWSVAERILENYREAILILQKGLRLAPAQFTTQKGNSIDLPKLYIHETAAAYRDWAFALRRKDPPDIVKSFRLLEEALKIDPGNDAVLAALIRFTRGESETAQRARETLKKMLAEGKASALVHMVLGSDAWVHGETDKARLHWEQAHRLEPDMSDVTNNLAWALVYSEPKDPQRALELINRSLRRIPNHESYLHTRGHVLMALQRWRDALTDLERVLRVRRKSAELHRSLATIYEKLNNPEMTREHRQRAEQLENKQKPPSGESSSAPSSPLPEDDR